MLKKMFFLVVFAITINIANVYSQNYSLDAKSSKIQWEGKKVIGKHNGTINLKSGSVQIKGTNIIGSFEIDMKSIAITDIKDEESNAKLKAHFDSDEFFSTNKFPIANFVITKSEPITGGKGENYKITGKLTIKNITNEISFPAKITFDETTFTANANFIIDRTKWDIKYGSGSFFDDLGDKAISNDISYKIKLNGTSK